MNIGRPGPERTGRTGRPDAQASEALDRSILETATSLFVEHGYGATSIEQIAAATGVGKQTIYRRYASKEDLFKAVVIKLSDTMIDRITAAVTSSPDPLTALREAFRVFLDVVCQPQSIALYRILIVEAQPFSEIIEHSRRNFDLPFEHSTKRLIAEAQAAGQLSSEFSDEAVYTVLYGGLIAWVLRQKLLCPTYLSDPAERSAFFDGTWTAVIEGLVKR